MVYDEGDWLCLQCGVYYYIGLPDHTGHTGDGKLRIARTHPGIRQKYGWTNVGLAS